MIQRVLMPYKMIVCASPEYLARHGTPAHPTELAAHELVIFTRTFDTPLKFYNDDQTIEVKPQSMITVNSGHALLNAAKSGLGIIVQPEILLVNDLEAGKLARVLPEWHLGERQISMLYYRHRNMTPKVRSFIDFAINEFCEQRR
jgi:DNA-binding transcriptional LysR family regulator